MELLTQSYWPMLTSPSIVPWTVGDALREASQAVPHHTALIEGVKDPSARRTWTYSALWDDAIRCAHALLQHFEPNERIAVWANNIPEWVILEFGAALANITLVTVNPAYQAAELQYVLQQSGAAGLFMVEEFHGNPMAKVMAAVRPALSNLRTVISIDSDWPGFLQSGTSARPLPVVGAQDIAQIQYTSGTTGIPKGAMLRHEGLVNNARFVAWRGGAELHQTWLSVIPLFHSSGSGLGVLGAVQTQGTQVLVPQFIPDTIMELIEAYHVDVAPMVPTMIQALFIHSNVVRYDLGSLRKVWSGGTNVPPDLVQLVETQTPACFSTVFGQTEASPIIAQTSPADSMADKTLTVGQPLPQTAVKIIDPGTGLVRPIGISGELCVQGYGVMAGYFDAPVATAAAIDLDGWLHTGDLCSMDPRGYITVEGRIKDMIIRGGENIYPKEIEDVLLSHPAIIEAVLVGISDPYWGEQAAAFVQIDPTMALTDEDLDALVRERLAAYKVPRYWIRTDHFPRTPLGKIQKFRLREQFASTPTQDAP